MRLRRLADGAPSLPQRAPLHIQLGTAHRVAKLKLLEGDELAAGTSVYAQLIFEAPICASAGDAFIVRDAQARHTVGGGMVLDPAAARVIEAAGEHFVFLTAHWKGLLDRAASALRAFHTQHPDEPGVDRGRLRRMTTPNVADPVWRLAVVAQSDQMGFNHASVIGRMSIGDAHVWVE